MRFQAEYLIIMELLFQLIQFMHGRNIEPGHEWLDDAQVLSIKLYNHLESMLQLAQGGAGDNSDIPHAIDIDHASVQVVTRTALETYLVFFFIYGQENKSLSQFRHKIWYLAGLLDRQNDGGLGDKAQKKPEEEHEEIQRLAAEIKRSEHFVGFSVKQGKKILAGQWRTGSSWKDLAEQAGFHGQYFDNMYSYFCGYAHSSYASVLQVRAARTRDDQEMLISSSLGIGLIIMAHFCHNYTCLFPDSNVVNVHNSEASKLAELFRLDHEDMARIVGE